MGAQLHFGRWQDALAHVDAVDAVICDPPYGARTHAGHNEIGHIERAAGTYKGKPVDPKKVDRPLNYEPWMPSDVRGFVDAWVSRCRGWFVSFTSHDLVPAYVDALEGAGRYVFAPLPFYSPGSRIRLSGDGPSSWTCWIVVARPKTRDFQRWGTLPGGYMHPPEDCAVVGGKPLDLMRAIVRDYSRPGDLVCDPFVGSGTTLLAAIMEGRRAVGAEQKREHYDIAHARLARGYTPTMFAE
jgi:hypothetical protein